MKPIQTFGPDTFAGPDEAVAAFRRTLSTAAAERLAPFDQDVLVPLCAALRYGTPLRKLAADVGYGIHRYSDKRAARAHMLRRLRAAADPFNETEDR